MSGTPQGPTRYQSKPRDYRGTGKVASQDNRYQEGIGQGHGSSWTPNSGQTQDQLIRSTQGVTGFQRPLAPATTIVGNFMPYTDATDPNLPEYVKALPDLKKRQWVAVWNSGYKRCRDKGGDECESSAFAQANGVVIKRASSKDLGEHGAEILRAMQQDAGAELEAIKLYSEHLDKFNDQDVQETLQHVIGEEHEHYDLFTKLVNKYGVDNMKAWVNKELGESRTSGANTTKSTATKVLQSVAEYSPTGGNDAMSCSNCFWYAGGTSCRVVQGTIAPNGLSRFWTAPGINDEAEADDMAAGKGLGLDESTLGLLLDWAQENPDQVEFMLDNLGKEKARLSMDPINQFHNMHMRSDRPMNGGPHGIMEGIDVKGVGSSDFFDPDAECHCAACEAVDDSVVELSKELGGLSWAGTKAKLTTSARDAMPSGQFAYVDPQGGKHFPIHDASHVRNALARLSQSPYGPKAKGKVCAAASKFGIDAPSCSSGGQESRL